MFKEMLELGDVELFTGLGFSYPLKKEAAPKNKGCESHEKIMQQP